MRGSKRLQAARKALATLNDRPTDLLVRILDMQGTLARRQGDLKAAQAAFMEAKKNLPTHTTQSEGQLLRYAVSINLISVDFAAGRHNEVIKAARALQTDLEGRLPDENQWSLAAATYLIAALIRTGQFDAATQQIETLKPRIDKKTDDYLYRVITPEAQIALYRGSSARAVAAFSSLLNEGVQRPGSLDREVSRRSLAHGLLQQGRTDEAVLLLKTAEENFLALTSNSKHPHVALTRILLGCAYLRLEDWRSAEASLRLAYADLLASRGAEHYGTLLAASYLALLPTEVAGGKSLTPELANRIERDLSWQFGATPLAAQLRRPDPLSYKSLPALL